MPAPKAIQELVERFSLNQDTYRAGGYNEAQVRQEFINPFWKALGWDVYNEQGYSESYKEVVHEDALQVQGKHRAPDYAFRLGGRRVFFVEAKKPAVLIKEDIPPAYQLRRYAWSAKLPLSILTDFEEFAVYDCRAKPTKTDKASVGRVLYLTYSDYLDRWDEIDALFSPEAIRKGALDRWVASTKTKRGTAEVDDAFLAEIEGWREVLARNMALRNPGLSVRELNRAVQMTIDRLIFLRICEDRGVEPYHRLGDTLLDGAGIYRRLGDHFRQADQRYNSGLFHFAPEKGREDVDDWTLSLAIDDKVLKGIIQELYYPDCPYEFSVLPADILGQVYEQFLGKVIRLTSGGRAKVEEKPEVKKAGGVYYTPTYIVDYIVEHTVGRLLEGKTPRQVRGSQRIAPLRVLDPACGSGTFLLQAYQVLLDWYLEQYVGDEPEVHARQGRLVPTPEGEWRLASEERKEILLAHIHGVDIDPQAVEVTKLSLLLKVLEGEQGAEQMTFLARERVLPDLEDNVRCGNSLIGPDYYAGRQATFLDEDEMYRVNAFDWKKGFPRAMAAGGFDAVIGNPPYIRIQAMKQWAPQEVEFYKTAYISASKGNYDIYVVFVEKGLGLLRRGGRLGYILPHKFFNAKYGEPLRGLIAEGRHLADVVHFGDQQVFAHATTYTCLLFLDKDGRDEFHMAKVDDLAGWRSQSQCVEGDVRARRAGTGEWHFVVGPSSELFERLTEMQVFLEDVTSRIFQGLKTSADKIYIVEELDRQSDRVKVFSREKDAEYWLEPDLLHPLIKGGDSRRYCLSRTNRLILFPYGPQEDGIVDLIPASVLKSDYPLTWAYLLANRKYLEDRERGRMRHSEWYAYIYPKALDVMSQPKLFTPDIAARSAFSADTCGDVFFTGGVAGGYGILVLPEYSWRYVLGLLNSRVLEWFIRLTATQMRGGYYSYESRFVRHLPIRTIDFSDPADAARHERMVALVERMLALHESLAQARTPQARRLLQQQVEVTDSEIDRLVYELYELTEEEIAIVEESKT